MVVILNRLRQPLTFNLKSGKSLYLFNKKQVTLSNEDFTSLEIQSALKRGDLMVISMGNKED